MLPELLWLHPPHPHPKACSSLDINLQRIRFPSGAAVICIWMQLSMHCAWGKGSSKWLFFLFPFFFYWKLSRHLWSLSSCLIPHLNLWTHLKPYLGYSLEGCGRRFCSQKSKFQCFVKNGVPQGASLGPSVLSLARLQAGKKKDMTSWFTRKTLSQPSPFVSNSSSMSLTLIPAPPAGREKAPHTGVLPWPGTQTAEQPRLSPSTKPIKKSWCRHQLHLRVCALIKRLTRIRSSGALALEILSERLLFCY